MLIAIDEAIRSALWPPRSQMLVFFSFRQIIGEQLALSVERATTISRATVAK
jgi:hypothetical protein